MQKPRRPTIFILLCGLRKAMVIPAKGGIQRGRGMGKCSAVEDFARRGACPPLGREEGRGRIRHANSLDQTTTPAFHTLVCRHQPA